MEQAAGEGNAAEAVRDFIGKEQPKLSLAESIIWEGFGHLGTERAAGMGFGPIPWRAITAYANYHRMSRQQADQFLKCILEMDLILVRARNRETARTN